MATGKVDLSNPIFHDEDAAREHLERLPWPQGPVCPRCGVMGERITKLAGKSTRPGVYKCKDCRKPFSVTVGTVMERSHIPLSKWVLAAQLMASSKKSMSAHQLHRMLGTNYETAWFLFHRLREAAAKLGGSGPLGGENKVVEAEADFKFNHRSALGYNDADRAAALLRGAKGKRLLYRQPDGVPESQSQKESGLDQQQRVGIETTNGPRLGTKGRSNPARFTEPPRDVQDEVKPS
jgi:transposase-like protein